MDERDKDFFKGVVRQLYGDIIFVETGPGVVKGISEKVHPEEYKREKERLEKEGRRNND